MNKIGIQIGPSTAVIPKAVPGGGPLVLGATEPYSLVNGTIEAIVIEGVTYTTDVDGQPITEAAVAMRPVCLALPSIAPLPLTAGDIATVVPGIWIYDANRAAPLMTYAWSEDGVSSALTGNTFTTTSAVELVVQERATQPAWASVAYESNAVTVAPSVPSRTIADVIADAGGDYFDFADTTTLFQDAGTTPVDADGQSVVQVIGQAGSMILDYVSGGSPVTYDATAGALVFDGASRGLRSASVDCGPGFVCVAAVTVNTLADRQIIAHNHVATNERSMQMRINTGNLQVTQWNTAGGSAWVMQDESLTIGTQYVLTALADPTTGDVFVQRDGGARATGSLPTPLETVTNTEIDIGRRTGDYLDGRISRLVLIPAGSVSEGDLQILEAWVGMG